MAQRIVSIDGVLQKANRLCFVTAQNDFTRQAVGIFASSVRTAVTKVLTILSQLRIAKTPMDRKRIIPFPPYSPNKLIVAVLQAPRLLCVVGFDAALLLAWPGLAAALCSLPVDN